MSLAIRVVRAPTAAQEMSRDVLGNDGIQEFRGCRQPDGIEFKEQAAGLFQTRIDIITSIQDGGR